MREVMLADKLSWVLYFLASSGILILLTVLNCFHIHMEFILVNNKVNLERSKVFLVQIVFTLKSF